MKKLLKALKEKARNCGVNNKENRARKGAYVDCIVQLEAAINYTHSYILGDLKDKTKMEIPKLIEREDEFCESIDCERTEDTRQFIYDSRNDKSVMNLPYVLLEYKQWLIDEGFIKELK